MLIKEIAFRGTDRTAQQWKSLSLDLAKIDAGDLANVRAQTVQALLDEAELVTALAAGDLEGEQDERSTQVRAILVDDLKTLAKLIDDPAAAGEVGEGAASVSAFEQTGPNSFIARGPAEPSNASGWLTPAWRVARLFDAGVMFSLEYDGCSA